MERDVEPLDRCLSTRQLCHRWGCAPKRVKEMVRKGMLTAIDLGKGTGASRIRFTPEAIAACEGELVVKKAPRRAGTRAARQAIANIAPEYRKYLE